MILKTASEAETMAAAAAFAATLTPRDIVLLNGDLGMGKSVFSRGIIRALSENPALNVPSPTFTLVQTYEAKIGDIWHFDLYRLKDPEELYEIGWEDALSTGVILVEWPERLDYLTPKNTIIVTLSQGENPTERVITIQRTNESTVR